MQSQEVGRVALDPESIRPDSPERFVGDTPAASTILFLTTREAEQAEQ
jgi:hypothetical protein